MDPFDAAAASYRPSQVGTSPTDPFEKAAEQFASINASPDPFDKAVQNFQGAPEVAKEFNLGEEIVATGKDLARAVTNPAAPLAFVRGGAQESINASLLSQMTEHDANLKAGQDAFVEQDYKDIQSNIEEGAVIRAGALDTLKPESYLGNLAANVTTSLGYMLPGMGVSMVSPRLGIPMMIGSFYPTTQGEAYLRGMDAGLGHEKSYAMAKREGIIEVATEMTTAGLVMKALKAVKAGDAIKPFFKQQLAELASEELATIGQSINASEAGLGASGKSGLEGVIEDTFSSQMVSQMVDTAVATAMQGSVVGTAMYPVMKEYKRRAIETVSTLNGVIKDAEMQGLASVTMGTVTLSVEDLKKQRDEIREGWELKETDIPSEPLIQPASSAPNSEGQVVEASQAEEVTPDLQATLDGLSEIAIEAEVASPKKSNKTLQAMEDILASGVALPDALAQLQTLRSKLTNAPSHKATRERLDEEIAILNREVPDESSNRDGGEQIPGGGNVGAATDEINLRDGAQTEGGDTGSVEPGGVGTRGVREGETFEEAGQGGNVSPVLPGVQGGISVQSFVEDEKQVNATPEVDERIVGFISDTLQKLGITADVIITTDTGKFTEGLVNEVKGIRGVPTALTLGAGILGKHTPFKNPKTGKTAHLIRISPTKARTFGNLGRVSLLEIAVHEALGHVAIVERLQDAPLSIRMDLEQDFKAFVTGKLEPGLYQQAWDEFMMKYIGENAGGERGLADFGIGENPTQQQFETLYTEWLANRISKALLKRSDIQSNLEKWWGALAKAIRKIYGSWQANHLDQITGVDSVDKFVKWMISDARTNLSVENLDTKGFIASVFDSMYEVNGKGKRILKDLGKIGFPREGGEVTLITKKEREQSGTRIKELEGNRTEIQDQFGMTLLTIRWDKHPKGVAWKMAQHLRDMLVLANMNKGISLNNGVKAVEYKTAEGKRVREKIRSFKPNSQVMKLLSDEVLRLVAEEGLSAKQAMLQVMSGSLSQTVRAKQDKVTERQYRLFLKYLTENPEEARKIHYFAEEEGKKEEAEKPTRVEAAAKQEEVPSANTFVSSIEDQVRELMDGFNGSEWIPNKGSENLSFIAEKVKERFESGGKDYYRGEAMVRNVVDTTIRSYHAQLVQEKIGASVVKKVKEAKGKKGKVANGFTEEELMALAMKSLVEFNESDIRVYHGTSKVISDVPLMAHADPNALYGPGIYTTEDHVDAESGHLIVTAGYAEGGVGLKFDSWESYNQFSQDLGKAMEKAGVEDNIIENTLRGMSGNGLTVSDTRLAQKYLADLSKYGHTGTSPNILPLEIDPAPTKEDTFDVDATYERSDFSDAFWLAVSSPFHPNAPLTGGQIYKALLEGGVNAYTNYMRESGREINRNLAKELGAFEHIKAAANKILQVERKNFITHKGGAITGGVPHQVWIALKDGLVKSALQLKESEVLIAVPDQLLLEDEESFELYKDLESDLAVRKSKRAQRIKEGPEAYIRKEPVKTKKALPKLKTQEDKDRKKAEKVANDNKFREFFGPLIQFASSKNLGIVEYLDKLPLKDPKTGQAYTDMNEKRKVIYAWHHKWMNMTSMVSQTEAIYRLSQIVGIINLETNTRGVPDFIRTIWPDHVGGLENLDELGKDIVISRLQAIIESRFGAKYDFNSEPRMDEMKEANRLQFEKLSPLRQWRQHFEYLVSRTKGMLDSTPAGRMLTDRLQRVLRHKTLYQREFKRKLRDGLKDYSTVESREQLYLKYIGEVPITSETDRKAVNLFRQIFEFYSVEMERVGIWIAYKGGRKELYKHNSGEIYFPHMWKAGAFNNPTAEMLNSVMYELGMVRTVNGKEVPDDSPENLAVAKRYLKQHGAYYHRIYAKRFANMEMAREVNLDGFIKDPFEVATKYVEQASARLAVLREFGNEPSRALTFYAMEHMRTSTADPDAFSNAVDVIGRITGIHYEDIALAVRDLTSHGSLIATSTMLMHSFLLQPSALVNAATAGGIGNTLSAMRKLAPIIGAGNRVQLKEWAQMIGADAFTLSRELFDAIMEDKTREKTDMMARKLGITAVDTWCRLASALVGKSFVRDNVIKMMIGSSKERARAERNLKWLSLDLRKIKEVETGIQIDNNDPELLAQREYYLNMGTLAFVEETNFVTTSLNTPTILRNNPWGRALTLFMKFSYHQGNFIKDTFKRDKGALAKQLLISSGVGPMIFIARLLAKGVDPEKEIKKMGVPLTLWRMYSSAGGLGLMGEMLVESFLSAAGVTSTRGRATQPAMLSTPLALAEAIGAASDYVMDKDGPTTANKIFTGAMLGAVVVGAEVGTPASTTAAAALSIARPALTRAIAPTKSQKKTTYLD